METGDAPVCSKNRLLEERSVLACSVALDRGAHKRRGDSQGRAINAIGFVCRRSMGFTSKEKRENES